VLDCLAKGANVDVEDEVRANVKRASVFDNNDLCVCVASFSSATAHASTCIFLDGIGSSDF